MESKLKAAAMDSVGELPAGYPHLPNYNFELAEMVRQSLAPKSDAWNDAGTKPDHPCLCQTMHEEDAPDDLVYQYWTGEFFSLGRSFKDRAIETKDTKDNMYQHVQWREVQP